MARQMKDSGIEWIGEIPEDWSVERVKNGFFRKKEEAHQEEPIVLSLARAGVKVRDISNNEGQLAESYFNYNLVEPGDFLLNPMDLYSGANCSISTVSGVISPAYINLRAKQGYNAAYYDYYFKTQYWAMAMFAHGKGVSFDNRWTLNANDLLNYYIPYPNIDEQDRIATFLDAKCTHIDTIIEKTKASIEEYKKLKQAVITQAVTKGVRGDRRMKDSGIEEIGEIPEEWGLSKTLNCLSMKVTDGPHSTPELYDEGICFISAEAVSCGKGKIDFSHRRGYVSQEFYDECCKKYIPEIDDIYMIKSGATTGRVSIVDTLEPKFTIWSPLAVFRCNRAIMSPMYLFYYFQSEGFQKQVELGWTYGTQQNIGMRTLEQLKICIPPISEQAEIISFLQRKSVEIDALITKKLEIIEELETYKKSLIYECVTGKREVKYDSVDKW